MKPAAKIVLVVVVISQLGFLGFALWAESRRQDQMQTFLKTMSDASDIQNGTYAAHQAIHQGDLKLYVVVPKGSTIRPPWNEGLFTMQDVIVSDGEMDFGPSEAFYETYNSTIKNAVANPGGVDWQIYLAVKAAKERGEWFEAKQPDVKEEPQETKASLPPLLRRMSAEEAFGPRAVEKPRQSRPLTTEEAFGPAPVEKKN